ncbi:MAG: U32 family peptidase, partial [Rhodobacterales bacterium]
GQRFLAINGIQTLSHTYLNLLPELDRLKAMGVSHYRLVPHTQDMVSVAQIYRDALDARTTADEAESKLTALDIPAPFANGFWHGVPGHQRVC